MLVLRFVVLIAGLALVGLALGYAVTRDRRYLRWAWFTVQAVLLLLVAAGLLYVFERVLLMI